MTIYLSGAINLVSQEELQREAEVYATNGWEYRDPTTHKVAVQLAHRDIEAFCEYLRSRPLDRRPKVWRDRDGNEHREETVSFYLNGSEMTGTWIRLRAKLNTQAQGQAQSPATGSAAAPSTSVRRAAAPLRRPPAAAAAAPSAVAQQRPATPERQPAWNTASLEPEEDDDIPF